MKVETAIKLSAKSFMSFGKRIIQAIGIHIKEMKSKTGISTIANSFQATILPLSYSARFKIKMKSWDEFLFVFPFNKFVIVWGNPINSNDSINDNNHAKIVENELNRITKLSDNLVK